MRPPGLDEARASAQMQIVDRAITPERKSWPPRVLLVPGRQHLRGGGNLLQHFGETCLATKLTSHTEIPRRRLLENVAALSAVQFLIMWPRW